MSLVIVSPRAREHAASIDAWWRENRAAASDMFLQSIDVAFEQLAANPLAGPRYLGLAEDVEGVEVRRLLLRRCRYHVYYCFDADLDRVEVLAIWHTSRGHGPVLR